MRRNSPLCHHMNNEILAHSLFYITANINIFSAPPHLFSLTYVLRRWFFGVKAADKRILPLSHIIIDVLIFSRLTISPEAISAILPSSPFRRTAAYRFIITSYAIYAHFDICLPVNAASASTLGTWLTLHSRQLRESIAGTYSYAGVKYWFRFFSGHILKTDITWADAGTAVPREFLFIGRYWLNWFLFDV